MGDRDVTCTRCKGPAELRQVSLVMQPIGNEAPATLWTIPIYLCPKPACLEATGGVCVSHRTEKAGRS